VTRIVTFTPSSVVPQGADDAVVYSSGALEAFGTDDTPAGWPTRGRLIAIEVELTVTSQFNSNRLVQVVVARPDTLDPIVGSTSDASGVWSGWQGEIREYRTSGVDGYFLDKFGGWLTDHLSFGPEASIIFGRNRVNVFDHPVDDEFDIEFRVRLADWDAANGRTISSTSGTAFLRPLIRCDTDGLHVRVGNNGAARATCPWGDLDVVDGEWRWLRVSYDPSNELRYWHSDDGTSWTLANTYTLSNEDTTTTTGLLRIGNGGDASGVDQAGLDGDLSHYSYANSTGVVQTLSLDAMTAQSDRTWTPDVGSDLNGEWSSGEVTARVKGATIPDTKRLRFEADTAYPITDVRLIVDAQIGELTVDEIQLEYIDRARRSLGLRR